MERISFFSRRKTRLAYARKLLDEFFERRPASRALCVMPMNPKAVLILQVAKASRLSPGKLFEVYYAARRASLSNRLSKELA